MSKKHIVITMCLAAVLMIMLAPDTYARKSLHDVRTWVYIHETEGHPWGEVAMRPGEPEQDNRTLFFVYIPYFNISIDLMSAFRHDSIDKRKIRKDKAGSNYAESQRIGREVGK